MSCDSVNAWNVGSNNYATRHVPQPSLPFHPKNRHKPPPLLLPRPSIPEERTSSPACTSTTAGPYHLVPPPHSHSRNHETIDRRALSPTTTTSRFAPPNNHYTQPPELTAEPDGWEKPPAHSKTSPGLMQVRHAGACIRSKDPGEKRKRGQEPEEETGEAGGRVMVKRRVRDSRGMGETVKEEVGYRENEEWFELPPPSGQGECDAVEVEGAAEMTIKGLDRETLGTSGGRSGSSSKMSGTSRLKVELNTSMNSISLSPPPTSTISTSKSLSKPSSISIYNTESTVAPPSNPPPCPTGPITRVALPTRTPFDAWNSSSTGHQRAENLLGGSTSWRQSRQNKLGEQFISGHGGGRRIADTVGAGSEDFLMYGRKANGGWEDGASGLRGRGQKDVKSWLKPPPDLNMDKRVDVSSKEKDEDVDFESSSRDKEPEADTTPKPPQIFASLTFYINGSTAPLISDHKLKRLLAAHGATIALGLARRSVTHVILGTESARGGVGGGLAGTKIQKEVARTGGKPVRFVGVEWVFESMKAGRRLPETRFETLKLAPKGQGSVLGVFRRSGDR